MPIEPDHDPLPTADAIAMAPDCTIRSIEAAYHALCHAARQPRPGGVLSIDCAAIEQVDITFIQLLVSTAKTSAARNLRVALHAPPACVREALSRSGVPLGAEPFFLS